MHRHPWIFAFFGVGSNLAMLVMIILVSWTRFLTGALSINSIKLLLLITNGLVSFNTYQYETYEPSKLYEITSELVRDFITSDEVRKVVEIYIVT